MRIFIGLALRIKARSLTAGDRDKVLESLSFRRRNQTLDALEKYIGQNADEATLSAMGHAEAVGDGSLLKMIIDFINAHWEDLFNLLLRLIGGMAVEMMAMAAESQPEPGEPEDFAEFRRRIRRGLMRLLDSM